MSTVVRLILVPVVYPLACDSMTAERLSLQVSSLPKLIHIPHTACPRVHMLPDRPSMCFLHVTGLLHVGPSAQACLNCAMQAAAAKVLGHNVQRGACFENHQRGLLPGAECVQPCAPLRLGWGCDCLDSSCQVSL